ncbi:conjugative transposon protein TraN [Rudanella paleaurantiibacter]|uniref:Conjugative transposon protein TraN n=1 Tax=Rudanella paleaurantiibacter TaxID=2614655 RepID=A0A7J5TT21_9BACT|nr:conjugative transposon protein TraN [Rudanella paleaurantiibacter]KAB7726679.1 conjugative transposon protein TraN [Rudanella paleaurantiibacter]
MKKIVCFLLIGSTSLTSVYAQKKAIPASYKRRAVSSTSTALATSAKGPVNVPASLGSDTAPAMPAAPANTAATPTALLPEMAAPTAQVIRSYPVELAYNKTVSIIFPAPVRSVDLGSRDIIADKAADVENVLKVKANQIGFNETNFSVITADGKFYSFVVSYNESPAALAMNLVGDQVNLKARTQPLGGTESQAGQSRPGQSSPGSVHFANVAASQSDLALASDRVLHKARRIRRIGDDRSKMAVKLKGVFVKENVLYYRVAFRNRSNLNYDLDYVRFFIVDKTVAKEASHQEIEVRPIYIHNGPIRTVKGHSQVEKVYAFQRFTIPADKVLQVQTGEHNGGRQLAFSVNNRVIMKAKPL